MIDIGNPIEIPEKSDALLEAPSLGRRRAEDGGWLLRDVGDVVRSGERVAVLDSSGTGRSQSLRALALLDPLDEGVVLWKGQAVRSEAVPSYRGAVLHLHQRPALNEGNVEAGRLGPGP